MAGKYSFYAIIISPISRLRSRIHHICVYKRWLKLSSLITFIVISAALYGIYAWTQQTIHQRVEHENARLRAKDERQRFEQMIHLEGRVKAVEDASRRLAEISYYEMPSYPKNGNLEEMLRDYHAYFSRQTKKNDTPIPTQTILISFVLFFVASLIVATYIFRSSPDQGDKKHNLSKLTKSLIHLLSSTRDAENILGDLQEELIIIIGEQGLFKARVWLYRQLFKSIPPLLYSRIRQLVLRLTESCKRLLIP